MWSRGRGPLPSTTDTVCVCVSAQTLLCRKTVSQSDRQWQQRREQHLATGWELLIQLLVVILTMEDIKKAIGEAEKELEVAERLVASKRSALMASVFLLGWLTFSFRLGPTCTVHQRGKTTANAKASNQAL